jgi:hypothetical protein
MNCTPILALWAAQVAAQPAGPVAVSTSQIDGLRIVQYGSFARASLNDQPVFEYHFEAGLPKPFIHPLLTPAGHEVTMLSPGDHVHHRGLMFALGSVAFAGEEGHVVFWGEAGDPAHLGHIIPRPGSASSGSGTGEGREATLTFQNDWRRLSDRALMLTENRRITLHDLGDPRCHLLTWMSELVAADRDLILGPTPGREVSYYGLGLRVPHDMDEGRIFDANGKIGEQAVNGDDARWCAYVGPNEPVRGFAMFDHPRNPRHPTGWFVMSAGFGYMTASIVCHEPYGLPAGEMLRLRYGVCAFDGSPSAEQIEQWYQRWVQLQERPLPDGPLMPVGRGGEG